ncbi:sensor histidine kinase [Meridianimarinicoccus roseus]|nr:histidine kinase dimerization/phosphoacceptor domain -containing protein [Meridianimarinicoccus roseus]
MTTPDRADLPRNLWQRLRRSLGARVAMLLSLALIPLGVIAVEQTRRVENELDRAQALNLRAITAELARYESASAGRALGAARAFAATLPVLAGDPVACRRTAEGIVTGGDGLFTFAGFLPTEGLMTCSSVTDAYDFSSAPRFRERMENPTVFASARVEGRVSRQPVISVFHPVLGPDGGMRGYVVVSLGARDLNLPAHVTAADIELAVVDSRGAVLGSNLPTGQATDMLPDGFVPEQAADDAAPSFSAQDQRGRSRDYAVEPIIEGVAYAVGARPLNEAAARGVFLSPAAYPVLMWLASLFLVLAVIETSLIGPVRTLSARITLFGRHRELGVPQPRTGMPSELSRIEEAFADMAGQSVSDERALMDALHERDALLREVHHRVKNNLQVISSMINLQARSAQNAETEAALARISCRIGGLGVVHRHLYEARRMDSVAFDRLLRDLAEMMTEAGQGLDTEANDDAVSPIDTVGLAPVRLTADDSMPATLFAVEALTTALGIVPSQARGRGQVRLVLSETAVTNGTAVCIRVESPAADAGPRGGSDGAAGDDAAARSSRRLIEAFARQVHGKWRVGRDGPLQVAELLFVKSLVLDPVCAPHATVRDGMAD